MSSSEDEFVESEVIRDELKFIAEKLNSYPEVLSKSQIPFIKRKKNSAIEIIIGEYEKLFGKKMEPAKFMKKVNNMKTRLKKKTDVKATGNKRIKLLDWEKVFFKAMEGDSNPTVSHIPGARTSGISNVISQEDLNSASTSRSISLECDNISSKSRVPVITPKSLPKKKSTLEKYETVETKDLTTTELQRIVLLEQLKTARVQGEYFQEKLKKLKSTSENITFEGDSSLYMM